MKKINLLFFILAAFMLTAFNAAAQTMTVNMRDGQKHQFNTSDIEQVKFDVPQQQQGPFKIEVSDITSVSAKITVTPDDPNLQYYFDVCNPADYDYYGASFIVENYFDTLLSQYPGIPLTKFLEAALSRGEDSDIVSGLPSDTDLVCYAIGVDINGKCVGEASVVPFRTLRGGDPADCTFDISYSTVRSTSLTVSVKPSDPSVRYWMGCYSASDWPGDITMAQVVKETLEEYSFTYGKVLEDVVNGVTFRGDINLEESGFEPSSSYYIYVYAMDENGEAAGPMFKKRFTTSAYDYSEAQVSLSYRYFDGNELAALYPDKFNKAKDQVVLQAVFTPNEVAQSYAWALAIGDLTDEEVYPEASTKNAVLQGGFITTPTKELIVKYGDATFLYFAADAYGLDGNLGRTLAHITREGASPVSTYEELSTVKAAPAPLKFNAAKIESNKNAQIWKRLGNLNKIPAPMRKCF